MIPGVNATVAPIGPAPRYMRPVRLVSYHKAKQRIQKISARAKMKGNKWTLMGYITEKYFAGRNFCARK